MTGSPDVASARAFAAGYLACVKPRWAALVGSKTHLSYSVEALREELGVEVTPHGVRIEEAAAALLVVQARTNPHAYQLFKELRDHGAHLTGGGAATVQAARVAKPKAPGNRERNGFRDLILSILWVELQEFGLPKENKVRTGSRAITPSIGAVISKELSRVMDVTMEPRAIMAAVLKQTKE